MDSEKPAATHGEHDDHHDQDADLSWRKPFVGIIRDVKRTLRTNYFKEITLINQKVCVSQAMTA